MNKQEFLTKLQKGLSGFPRCDIEERLSFYSEMIDDRMEEGLSEEDAVSEIGPVDAIVSEITLTKTPKEAINPRKRRKAWEIVLLVLGSPVWLSLLLAAFAVILSFYIVLWSGIISLWAVFGSLIGCAFAAIAAGIGFTCGGNGLVGTAMIGAGVVCTGASIFLYYGSKAATKGILLLTKKIALIIKNGIIIKEEA